MDGGFPVYVQVPTLTALPQPARALRVVRNSTRCAPRTWQNRLVKIQGDDQQVEPQLRPNAGYERLQERVLSTGPHVVRSALSPELWVQLLQPKKRRSRLHSSNSQVSVCLKNMVG
jgi:hypothetical protein